jgi:hypothetical protein
VGGHADDDGVVAAQNEVDDDDFQDRRQKMHPGSLT